MPTTDDLSALVAAAQRGSKEALDSLVRAVERPIYNMALRMLQRPTEAEDAAQEILIKLVTQLGQFRGESSFSTWMYRVATNHLLNQRRRADVPHLSFDQLAERITIGLAHDHSGPEEAYEEAELSEEIRRNCTLGMLQCLDPEDRLVVILADILEVSGAQGAEIMDLTPALFRKRLSRARQVLVAFVSGQCGIVNPANPCRCHRLARVRRAVGSLHVGTLQYNQPLGETAAHELDRAHQAALQANERTVALLRAHPTYAARADLAACIERLFSANHRTPHPPAQ